MKAFHLSFRTDNAAFSDGNLEDEITRILIEVARSVRTGAVQTDIRFAIHDINGNRVGSFHTEPSFEDSGVKMLDGRSVFHWSS